MKFRKSNPAQIENEALYGIISWESERCNDPGLSVQANRPIRVIDVCKGARNRGTAGFDISISSIVKLEESEACEHTLLNSIPIPLPRLLYLSNNDGP